MKISPILSRLSSHHTAETDAAFSFVMLTVVAVVALLPLFLLSLTSPSFLLLRGLFVLALAVGGDFP